MAPDGGTPPRPDALAALRTGPYALARMNVVVNGERREVPPETTVAGLLVQLGWGDERVAVERNAHIVPRAEHGATVLREGDELEVVNFVGGG